MQRILRLLTIAIIAVGVAEACSDKVTTEPSQSIAPVPANGTSLQIASLTCQASITAKSVECAPASATSAGRSSVLIGKQNTFIKLTSSAVAYTAADSSFKFNMTVQNLIPQALGTTNGTSGSSRGVEIF